MTESILIRSSGISQQKVLLNGQLHDCGYNEQEQETENQSLKHKAPMNLLFAYDLFCHTAWLFS